MLAWKRGRPVRNRRTRNCGSFARIEEGTIRSQIGSLASTPGISHRRNPIRLRSQPGPQRAAAGIHGEPIVCVDFPQPVGGGSENSWNRSWLSCSALTTADRRRDSSASLPRRRHGDARGHQQQRQRHGGNGPNHRQRNIPWQPRAAGLAGSRHRMRGAQVRLRCCPVIHAGPSKSSGEPGRRARAPETNGSLCRNYD